jgi:putative FmdB family regulatory protein
MPVYQYKCNGCSFTFELMVKVGERDDACVAPCSRCDSTVVRVPIPCAFVLKGEGWAKDGYTYPTKNALNREDV